MAFRADVVRRVSRRKHSAGFARPDDPGLEQQLDSIDGGEPALANAVPELTASEDDLELDSKPGHAGAEPARERRPDTASVRAVAATAIHY